MSASRAMVRESRGRGGCRNVPKVPDVYRRSTRSYEKCRLNECQFADDAVLLATIRHGAEKAVQSYIETVSAFDLTVSISRSA